MALNITRYQLNIELLEDLLGTVPRQKNLHTKFVADKARESLANMQKKGLPLADGTPVTEAKINELVAEEQETVEEIQEKGHTGFHKDAEGWFLYDYAIKGFLCEAARTLKAGKGEDSDGEVADVKQLQDKVKRFLFVRPRRIRLSEPSGVLERPLRAQTALGPRVALVKSDFIAAGSQLVAELHLLKGSGLTTAILQDILAYGNYMGLGQWRSGGYGRFSYSLVELD